MTDGASLFAIPGFRGSAFRQVATRAASGAAARSRSPIPFISPRRGHGSLPPDPAAPEGSRAEVGRPVARDELGPGPNESSKQTQIVAFVDDDESVREALSGLLSAFGIHGEGFASAEDFLLSGPLDRVSCLVTDVRLRGISGLDLLDRLAKMSLHIPTIVMSARADGRVRDEALIGGAVEFLRKPIAAAELISSIQTALRRPTELRDEPPSG